MEYKALKVTDRRLLDLYQAKADEIDLLQSKIYNKKEQIEKETKKQSQKEIIVVKTDIEKEIEELKSKLSILENKEQILCISCKKGNYITINFRNHQGYLL
jgi:hypothetical protein